MAGNDVKPASLNLSWSLPLVLPQSRVSLSISIVGMLMTNSLVSSMRACECLLGLTLMATNGGFIEVGIAHARVMMLGLPVLPMHVTSTVCIGWTSRMAV